MMNPGVSLYSGLYLQGDLVMSALYPDWSDITALKY